MNLLFILSELPFPVTNGVRLKTFSLLKAFSKQHECDVIAFTQSTNSKISSDVLQVCGAQAIELIHCPQGFNLFLARLFSVASGNPPFQARWTGRKFEHLVQKTLRNNEYSAVIIDGLALAPIISKCKNCPTILSTTDAVSLGQRRSAGVLKPSVRKIYRKFSAWRTVHFERKWLGRATIVHTVTEVDADYLESVIGVKHVEAIPLPLPEEVFHLPDPDSHEDQGLLRVLVCGSFGTHGTAEGVRDFIHDVLPGLLVEHANLHVKFVGKDLPDDLFGLIAQSERCMYSNWVDDFYSEVNNSDVVLIPDYAGTGMKTRALVAMGIGKPLVATALSMEGMKVQNGVECLLYHSPVELCSQLRLLLSNKERALEIGANAKRFITERYAPYVIETKWEYLLNRTVRCKVKD